MSSWPSWATGIPRKKKRGVGRKDKGIEKKKGKEEGDGGREGGTEGWREEGRKKAQIVLVS